MARGTQLGDLVTQLRAEAGHSTVAAAGIDNKPALVQIINRVQEVLFDDYNWPFKKVMPYLTLTAGTRYYDLPASIDFEHIVEVAVWYSGQPQRIHKGIGFNEYRTFNSDANVQSSPVLRWDIKYIGSPTNREQLEVWPIPVSDNDQQLQFSGTTKLVKMVADDDVAMLDDSLIVLSAASEILARQKSEDAPLKQKMAKARYSQLRAKYGASDEPFIMGGGVNPPSGNRGKTIVIAR